MLHFVTSYIKQNQIRKQTLESAQNRLEIIINMQMTHSDTGQWQKQYGSPVQNGGY